MPQKLNKAGKMQDYIPAGNGDPSGEYGTSNGTNKNFTTSDKKSSKANVITENKSVVVENKEKKEKEEYELIKKQEEEKQSFKPKHIERLDKLTQKTKDLIDKEPQFNTTREAYNYYSELEDEARNGMYNSYGYKDQEIIDKWKKQVEIISNAKKEAVKKVENSKANVIDNDLTGKKEYQLDSELVKQANSTKAFYEAGDNIQNKLDYYIKEIDNFDLTPEEKKQAKDKLFNLATDSLKSTSKNMSWVRSGRGNFDFKKSDKTWDKEMKDRNTFENYFNELKSNNEKKAKQSQAKTEQERYIEAYKKANETGALEMTVNGKTYVRSRKTSRTWYEK